MSSHEAFESSHNPEGISQRVKKALRTRLTAVNIVLAATAMPFEIKGDLLVQDFGVIVSEPQVVNLDSKPPMPRCRYQAEDGTCSWNFFKGSGKPSLAVYAEDPKTSQNSAEYVRKMCTSANKPEDQQRCDQYKAEPFAINKLTEINTARNYSL